MPETKICLESQDFKKAAQDKAQDMHQRSSEGEILMHTPGGQIKAHRCILLTRGSTFRELIALGEHETTGERMSIGLRHRLEQETLILKLVYGQTVEVNEVADEERLRRVAEHYGLELIKVE